ncbi:MAG: hypothetical protein J6X49_16265 [Victivallales bacterium]|nr:hypothetical protein [Victivallales bacterium]
MNRIQIFFLIFAIVAVMLNIVAFMFLNARGGGFKPLALILRIIFIAIFVFSVFMIWNCRKIALYGRHHHLVSKFMKSIYDSDRFQAINLEWSYEKVQSQILGEYVAEKHEDASCIILREPMLKNTKGLESSNALYDGLVDGLDGRLKIVKVLDLPMLKEEKKLEPGEEEPVPMGLEEKKWSAADLDEMLAYAGEFDILITCVQLPEGVVDADGQFMIPSLDGKKLAMAGGYSKEYDAALEADNVIAAVTYKEDVRFDEKDIPDDARKAFDNRYILLKGGKAKEKADAESEDVSSEEEK